MPVCQDIVASKRIKIEPGLEEGHEIEHGLQTPPQSDPVEEDDLYGVKPRKQQSASGSGRHTSEASTHRAATTNTGDLAQYATLDGRLSDYVEALVRLPHDSTAYPAVVRELVERAKQVPEQVGTLQATMRARLDASRLNLLESSLDTLGCCQQAATVAAAVSQLATHVPSAFHDTILAFHRSLPAELQASHLETVATVVRTPLASVSHGTPCQSNPAPKPPPCQSQAEHKTIVRTAPASVSRAKSCQPHAPLEPSFTEPQADSKPRKQPQPTTSQIHMQPALPPTQPDATHQSRKRKRDTSSCEPSSSSANPPQSVAKSDDRIKPTGAVKVPSAEAGVSTSVSVEHNAPAAPFLIRLTPHMPSPHTVMYLINTPDSPTRNLGTPELQKACSTAFGPGHVNEVKKLNKFIWFLRCKNSKTAKLALQSAITIRGATLTAEEAIPNSSRIFVCQARCSKSKSSSEAQRLCDAFTAQCPGTEVKKGRVAGTKSGNYAFIIRFPYGEGRYPRLFRFSWQLDTGDGLVTVWFKPVDYRQSAKCQLCGKGGHFSGSICPDAKS